MATSDIPIPPAIQQLRKEAPKGTINNNAQLRFKGTSEFRLRSG
jgi:hypothetical protein